MDNPEIRKGFYKNIFYNFDKVLKQHPYLWSCDKFQQISDFLIELGIVNPAQVVRIINNKPTILCLSVDSLRQKVQAMRELGFDNPTKVISHYPNILTMSSADLKNKIDNLQESGFANSIKMATSSPSILGHSFGYIESKINSFKDLGFANPAKVIALSPNIIGLSLDKIRDKIDFLYGFGFKNPVKMIGTFPAILGLRCDNIEMKVSCFKRILPGNYLEFIEYTPSCLSFKRERIMLAARIVYDKKISPSKVNFSHCLINPNRFIDKDELNTYPKTKKLYYGYYSIKDD